MVADKKKCWPTWRKTRRQTRWPTWWPIWWPTKKNDIDIDINMEIQFGKRVGHGGWLVWPKLLRPKAYPTCVSSKLCEFIHNFNFTI